MNRKEAERVLEAVREAFGDSVCPADPTGPADDWQREEVRRKFAGVPWREVPAEVLAYESSALAYFDSFRARRLPASLLQAQRDYFGAHTYERVDEDRGKFFHLDWPEGGRPEVPA